MIWIQVCSKEGSRPFPYWDTYKIAKIHWQSFKIFFSRINSATKHSWVKGIQGFTNKDHSIFKNVIMRVISPNQRNDITIIYVFLSWTGFSSERCGLWSLVYHHFILKLSALCLGVGSRGQKSGEGRGATFMQS